MDSPTDELRAAHDVLAAFYVEHLAGMLERMPVERAVLDLFAELTLAAGLGAEVGDVGCGTGRLAPYLASKGLTPRGVDLSAEMVRVARRDHPGFSFEVADLRALPFPDGSLAGVVCWYSLLFLAPEDRAVAFGELARVVRPGGYFVTAYKTGDGTHRRAGGPSAWSSTRTGCRRRRCGNGSRTPVSTPSSGPAARPRRRVRPRRRATWSPGEAIRGSTIVRVEIGVLGPLELRTDAGEPVPVAGARLRTLLILLALDAGRTVSADRLIDGIWAEEPPAAAGNALQALVSRLRRAGLTIDAGPAGYRLAIAPDRVDAHRFTRLATTSPAEALPLWRGEPEFPAIARPEAAALDRLRLTAQRDVLAGRLSRGEDVTAELDALVQAHPLDEPLTGLLMRAQAAAGRPGEALRAYQALRRRLADTFGADPAPELADLHLELLRAGRPARRGNLPAEVSSFVGRESDVGEVRGLLAEHRLVTLTEPGGSGKTRLSVQIGAAMPDEVWRVELAPVTDPAEVPTAILTALGMRSQVLVAKPGGDREQQVDPLTRLTDGLSGRRMLLILDNCEHLITAAAQVAEAILRSAPRLRLLATSREPLGIPGERLRPVGPLSLPPAGAGPGDAGRYAAVRLLLDRAPALTLDAENTEPIVRIVRALDGIPLAIELAAARLRTLPPDVLADRLADRFRLLTGGSRTALPRHRTLRAVVDWSWDLLDEPERALWRRFAMFHGGAGPDAVERVCGTDLAVIGSLVDKSLLVLAGGRYRMLETIREYGLERLTEAGETEWMRRTLAAWLTGLATRQETRLRSSEQLDAVRVLTEEHDNLHAAIRAAVDAGDYPAAAALAARLGWYWWLTGHRTEGMTLAREVITMPGAVDGDDRALNYTFAALNGVEGLADADEVERWFREAERLVPLGRREHSALRLVEAVGAAFRRGAGSASLAGLTGLENDPDPWVRAVSKLMSAQLRLNFGAPPELPEAEMREGLAQFRAIGERWGIGFSLSSLGDLAAARGDFAQALVWQREAIALVREVGPAEDLPQMQAKTAHQLWMAGEHDEARRVIKEAAEAAAETAAPEIRGSIGYAAATIARSDGDLVTAREHLDRAWDGLSGRAGAPQFQGMIASARGLVSAAAGDLATARRQHTEALRILTPANDAPALALALVGIADLRLREGDPAHAARLLGAAVAVRGSADRTVSDVDRIEAEARAALGDDGFAAEYAAGGSATMATAPALTGLEP